MRVVLTRGYGTERPVGRMFAERVRFAARLPSLGLRWGPAILVIVAATGRVHGEDWHKKLREEAPAAWEELRSFYTHVEGALTKTEKMIWRENAEQSFSKRTHVEFLVSGGLLRGVTSNPTHLTGRPIADVPADKAACVNTKYSFLLTRRPGATDWVIEHVSRSRVEEFEREEAQRRALQHWAEYLWAPWWAGGVSFAELLQRPGFQLESIEPTATASPLVTVKFKYSASDEELKQRSRLKPLFALSGGRFVFSPRDHWSLVESELSVFEGAKEKTTIEYGARVGEFRAPHRITRTLSASNYEYEFSAVIDRIAPREAVEEEFTLAAFGLADPSLRARGNRVPTWLWVAMVGGALLAMGVGFGWLKRRAALRKA